MNTYMSVKVSLAFLDFNAYLIWVNFNNLISSKMLTKNEKKFQNARYTLHNYANIFFRGGPPNTLSKNRHALRARLKYPSIIIFHITIIAPTPLTQTFDIWRCVMFKRLNVVEMNRTRIFSARSIRVYHCPRLSQSESTADHWLAE